MELNMIEINFKICIQFYKRFTVTVAIFLGQRKGEFVKIVKILQEEIFLSIQCI